MPDIPPYSVPVPDPTLLTTEALRREIAWTREITDEKFKAFRDLHDVLERRMAAEVAALGALSLERRAAIEQEMKAYRETTEGLFKAVDNRFHERDVRFDQAAAEAERAVQAALASLNLQFARTESQFNKQIDQLGSTLTLTNANMTQRLDDLKTNVSEIQGNRQGSMQMVGWGIGAAGVIIAVVTAAFSIVHFVPK